MKTIIYGFILLSPIFFSSCDDISFSDPQPDGVKNLYEFPKWMRGTWVSSKDTTIVTKTTHKRIEFHWSEIALDSLEKNADIKLLEKKVYLPSDSTKGHDYYIKNDSIHIFHRNEKRNYQLCDTVFLRKLNRRQYILNEKEGTIDSIMYKSNNGVISDDILYDVPGWSVFLIESTKNKSIVVRFCPEDDKELLEKIAKVGYLGWYFEEYPDSSIALIPKVKLNKAQVNQFISIGGFSDTGQILLKNQRIQN